MKRTYLSPRMRVYKVQVDDQLLASSITPKGSSNSLMFSDENADADEEARVKSGDFQWDW